MQDLPRLPRGEQARYQEIVAAYDTIWDWATTGGQELAGTPREVYSEDESGQTIELEWPVRIRG